MSKKSWRSLITFIVLLALGVWFFADTRTPQERGGQVSIDPGQ